MGFMIWNSLSHSKPYKKLVWSYSFNRQFPGPWVDYCCVSSRPPSPTTSTTFEAAAHWRLSAKLTQGDWIQISRYSNSYLCHFWPSKSPKIIQRSKNWHFRLICNIFNNSWTDISDFMILRYLLSSLFSRPVPPTQAEYFCLHWENRPQKRERTINNAKSC